MAEETNEQISSGDEARARAAARFEHLQNELKAKREFDIQVCVNALLVDLAASPNTYLIGTQIIEGDGNCMFRAVALQVISFDRVALELMPLMSHHPGLG